MQQVFCVTNLLMDVQFEPLCGKLSSIKIALIVLSNYEHVGYIERFNIMVKERSRAIFNTIPYPKLPNCMVIETLHFCIFWLNIFPL